MTSLARLNAAARRLWAPALLLGVVLASGYVLQAVQDPDAQPQATSATR